MKDQKLIQSLQLLLRVTTVVLSVVVLLLLATVYYVVDPSLALLDSTPNPTPVMEAVSIDEDLIEDGIHVKTGLIDDTGLELVVQNCTRCHSAKLITQNRANEEGWRNMIIWMQETQNLWDLGKNEALIVEYLAKNYPPGESGRRPPLSNIEWYELD